MPFDKKLPEEQNECVTMFNGRAVLVCRFHTAPQAGLPSAFKSGLFSFLSMTSIVSLVVTATWVMTLNP